jgi:hypothetical protein
MSGQVVSSELWIDALLANESEIWLRLPPSWEQTVAVLRRPGADRCLCVIGLDHLSSYTWTNRDTEAWPGKICCTMEMAMEDAVGGSDVEWKNRNDMFRSWKLRHAKLMNYSMRAVC